jgi:Cu/Ag efflux protein CusF
MGLVSVQSFVLKPSPETSREMVMMHYQETSLQMTQSFLATQQEVMLCYLQYIRSFQQSGFQIKNPYQNQVPTRFQIPEQALNPMLASQLKQLLVPEMQQKSIEPASNPVTAQHSPLANLPYPTARMETDLIDTTELIDLSTIDAPLESALELDNDALVAALLALVSERTGYPVEMLEPNLDLEADLGIDSIKRIEILNKFQTLLPTARRALLETSIEELAGARTLNQIIDWITKPLVESSMDSAQVSSLPLEE